MFRNLVSAAFLAIFGLSQGAVAAPQTGPITCTTAADCPAGVACCIPLTIPSHPGQSLEFLWLGVNPWLHRLTYANDKQCTILAVKITFYAYIMTIYTKDICIKGLLMFNHVDTDPSAATHHVKGLGSGNASSRFDRIRTDTDDSVDGIKYRSEDSEMMFDYRKLAPKVYI
ncbi:hypothetical protein FB451DRAFT_1168491 [Mycena latifolia]|nr:hypothetical protein FB451DRAFT_1168491 [Mycena latifolia]